MKKDVEELREVLEEELNVEDEALEDEDETVNRYDITSYGIDFDADGLVKRVERSDIFIPPFQRKFVWSLAESSRLIESLLLGLPVPGIFLAQEQETGKMLVIDGQQRILSIAYFFSGFFTPIEGATKKKVFKLSKVHPQYAGKTFKDLEPKERTNLENCVIHATVVKQDAPANDDTSIYHIFERLNSGGRKLFPQEIRNAVYHGKLVDSIRELNTYPSWRKIFGSKNNRMKDQELIVRYFAMLEDYENYEPPMKDFLSRFTKKHRNDSHQIFEEYSNFFKKCCDIYLKAIEKRLFRRNRAINVAFYEAAMVALTEKIKQDRRDPSLEFVKEKYQMLLKDQEFDEAVSQATGNRATVIKRMNTAKKFFVGT